MIQRYKVYQDGYTEDDKGRWCHTDDVAQLEAENARLKEENGGLKAAQQNDSRTMARLGKENAHLKAKLDAVVHDCICDGRCPPNIGNCPARDDDRDDSAICSACWDKWKEE